MPFECHVSVSMLAASRSCGLNGVKLREFIDKFLFHLHSEGKVLPPKKKFPPLLFDKKIPYLIPSGCTVKELPILQQLGITSLNRTERKQQCDITYSFTEESKREKYVCSAKIEYKNLISTKNITVAMLEYYINLHKSDTDILLLAATTSIALLNNYLEEQLK